MGGEVKINGRVGIFVKFNKREGGCNFKISVNIDNEWKERYECLILMLNLKVNKQTSEVCKNKVIIKRVSNILIN